MSAIKKKVDLSSKVGLSSIITGRNTFADEFENFLKRIARMPVSFVASYQALEIQDPSGATFLVTAISAGALEYHVRFPLDVRPVPKLEYLKEAPDGPRGKARRPRRAKKPKKALAN